MKEDYNIVQIISIFIGITILTTFFSVFDHKDMDNFKWYYYLSQLIILYFFVRSVFKEIKKIEIRKVIKYILLFYGLILIALIFLIITLAIFYYFDNSIIDEILNNISEEKRIKLTFKNLINSIQAILLTPFFEELIFRGIIFVYLRKRLRLNYAILISGLIFCLLHHPSAYLMSFSIGIYNSWLYNKEENLSYCIILHIFQNTWVTIANFI